MDKFLQYLRDVRAEMAKVTWPTWAEVQGATTLVIVFSLVFSGFIKVFDLVLNYVMGFVLNL
jgi:preprotein translocase subunit SecE